ncbi:MAG: Preprotein translocase SecG subunit [Acidobacteriota bacterium]|nr:Preprotein translocase SecG subunit [Acidobacteriota bacterium]
MTTLLYILFILSSIVLIVSILLQPGKADAGALFSSSISSTAFGPRGTQTILAKLTIGAAALFMLVAIALSLPAITGQRSAVQNSTAEETPPPSSPAPAASPATAPAQSAANTDATQNTTAAPGQTAPAASPESSANTGAPPASSK